MSVPKKFSFNNFFNKKSKKQNKKNNKTENKTGSCTNTEEANVFIQKIIDCIQLFSTATKPF